MPSAQFHLNVYAALRRGYADTGFVPSFDGICQMLPHSVLHSNLVAKKSTKAKVREILAKLVERDILLPEGKFSKRHHLTERGFIWIKKASYDEAIMLEKS